LRPTQASLTYSYSAIGAIAAVLLLARPLDKFGPMTAVMVALASILAILYLGRPGLSGGAIMATAILAYALCSGTHTSLNATVGLFYPTSIRGNGVGYATAMGRVSSIVGPVLTGYLLSAKMPLRQTLYLVASPYLVVAIVCFGLGLMYKRRSSGSGVDATPKHESMIRTKRLPGPAP
jgi:MFS family permease